MATVIVVLSLVTISACHADDAGDLHALAGYQAMTGADGDLRLRRLGDRVGRGRGGDQEDHADVGAERDVVRHEVPRPHHRIEYRVAARLYLEDRFH